MDLGIRDSLLFSVLFDGAALATIVATAAFIPTISSKYFKFGERALRRLAQRPSLAVSVSGVLAIILAVGMSLIIGIPEPKIHDEFSYLLAADTFEQGRLANPTHPLWVHFESMHIIQQPSYASKYPPAQGLVLGLGQILGGHPIVGVWVSSALASAAICWMLFAWMPGYWAFLGGILAALHPTMLDWSQNYWGGSVAALGGALLLGGFRRLFSMPRARDACLMALGILILANSRPYEGLLFSIPPLVILMVWMVRSSRPAVPVLLKQLLMPASAVVIAGAIATGFYNARITGNPFQMPYQVHEATYAVSPTFIWQERKAESPRYNHPELARFHHRTPSIDSLSDLVSVFALKIAKLIKGYFRPLVLALPLLAIPWILKRDWWMRFALLQGVVFLTGLFAGLSSKTHYAAPAMGLVFLFVLQGMRHMRLHQWHSRPSGLFLVRASVLLWLASLFTTYVDLSSLYKRANFAHWRAQIRDQLEQDGRRHLVIVRYKPDHNTQQEWVYNKADIDAAKIVWARDMNSNHRLLEHFADRQVWLLEADARPPTLVPYGHTGDQEVHDEAFSDHAGLQ